MIYLRAIYFLGLVLAMSGCGLARVYNKIELGQPLPADLGLVEVIEEETDSKANASNGERTFTMDEYYVWHTPLTTSLHRATVITDPDNKVTARMLDTVTTTNLLVAVTCSTTHSMEITVPAKLVANPKDVALGDIIPKYLTWWAIDHTVSASARKALTITGNGSGYVSTPLYVAMIFDAATLAYTRSIPLSSVLKPGYRETVLAHSTGLVTLTNLGDNRLRIETSTWLVTDPTGISGFLSIQLMGTCQIPPHYDNN